MKTKELLGQSTESLEEYDENMFLHSEVLSPLKKLQEKIFKESGCRLGIISAHRDFERQLAIWNAKAEGTRPVLDEDNNVLNPKDFAPDEFIFKILRFSALPGLSRHHWGSDFDVFDLSRQTKEEVQLTPDEWEEGGPNFELTKCLDHILQGSDFTRPYLVDRGGVAKEKWHLSFAPIANQAKEQLKLEDLKAAIELTDIKLKEEILGHLEGIFERFHLGV